jgi:hypothetical protein
MVRVHHLLCAWKVALGRVFFASAAYPSGMIVVAVITLGGLSVRSSAGQVKLVVEASVPETGEALQRYEQFITVSDQGDFSVVQLAHGNDTWQFYEGYVSGRVTNLSLSAGYGLQNTKAFPVAFQVTVELPVSQLFAFADVGGRTTGIFGSSSTLGEATLSSLGSAPFFEGQLDGSPVIRLHSAPFSFISAPGEFASIPLASLGFPEPTEPGPAIAQFIAMRNSFVLTGEGTMSVGNDFIAQPVPEPCAARLLALGMLTITSMTRMGPRVVAGAA